MLQRTSPARERLAPPAQGRMRSVARRRRHAHATSKPEAGARMHPRRPASRVLRRSRCNSFHFRRNENQDHVKFHIIITHSHRLQTVAITLRTTIQWIIWLRFTDKQSRRAIIELHSGPAMPNRPESIRRTKRTAGIVIKGRQHAVNCPPFASLRGIRCIFQTGPRNSHSCEFS